MAIVTGSIAKRETDKALKLLRESLGLQPKTLQRTGLLDLVKHSAELWEMLSENDATAEPVADSLIELYNLVSILHKDASATPEGFYWGKREGSSSTVVMDLETLQPFPLRKEGDVLTSQIIRVEKAMEVWKKK